MFQNDPMLWQQAAKDREQTLLAEAEAYRRAKQVKGNGRAPLSQKLVMALTAAPVILVIAWVVAVSR